MNYQAKLEQMRADTRNRQAAELRKRQMANLVAAIEKQKATGKTYKV